MSAPPPIAQIAIGMDELPQDQQRLIVEHIYKTRGAVDAAELKRSIDILALGDLTKMADKVSGIGRIHMPAPAAGQPGKSQRRGKTARYNNGVSYPRRQG